MEIELKIKKKEIPLSLFEDIKLSINNCSVKIYKEDEKFKNSSGVIEGLSDIVINVILEHIKDELIFNYFLPIVYKKWNELYNNMNAFIIINFIYPTRILQINMPTEINKIAIENIESFVILNELEFHSDKEVSKSNNTKPRFKAKFDTVTQKWHISKESISNVDYFKLARERGDKFNS